MTKTERAAQIAHFLEMVAYNERSAANARAIGAEFLARQFDDQAADCRKFAKELEA